MPIHDWSRVQPGVFHYFHEAWTIELSYALNGGLLPAGYFALADQVVDGPVPDVVTLQRRAVAEGDASRNGGIVVEEAPPRVWLTARAKVLGQYAARANRIAIHHELGDVVAVIEIVSPGNKSSRHSVQAFIEKAEELLRRGVNLMFVDLLPPTPRDPEGLHKILWDRFDELPFALPPDKRLTAAAYSADGPTAYVEPLAVGETLPSLPIFLDPRRYVPAPLEATYATTWSKCPSVMHEHVEGHGA